MLWLCSDLLLAITGFFNAITTDEFFYADSTIEHLRNQTSEAYYDGLTCEDDGMITDEVFWYQVNEEEAPCAKKMTFWNGHIGIAAHNVERRDELGLV